MGVTSPVLIAVDAGNSKTDLAVVDDAGRLLARGRSSGFRPHVQTEPVALQALRQAVDDVLAAAGRPPVALLAASLANADLPEQELRYAATMRGWGAAARILVGNDTFALLRSGSATGVGVAVVCGAGINCVGVGPGGAQVRFPALGEWTGDWGGGIGLSGRALFLAVRAEDGRGTPTALSAAVATHFGRPTATAVGIALHEGDIAANRLIELTPVLSAAAESGDPVARQVISEQAAEVLLMAGTTLRRLGLLAADVDIVLGGGVITAGNRQLMAEIREGMDALAPGARIVVSDVPPLAGAVLLGADQLIAEGVWAGEAGAIEDAVRSWAVESIA